MSKKPALEAGFLVEKKILIALISANVWLLFFFS